MAYKKFFKMKNDIFAEEGGKLVLNAREIQLLCVMYSLDVHEKGWVKVRQSVLASKCACSVSTVKRTAESLENKGYIRNKIRTVREDRKLSTYIYILPKISGKNYFTVSRTALKKLSMLTSDNTALTRMYLFFCMCARNRKRDFWRSFSDIADRLHVKRNAVIKSIKQLLSLKLITKTRRMTTCGDFTENYYTLSDEFEHTATSTENINTNTSDTAVILTPLFAAMLTFAPDRINLKQEHTNFALNTSLRYTRLKTLATTRLPDIRKTQQNIRGSPIHSRQRVNIRDG